MDGWLPRGPGFRASTVPKIYFAAYSIGTVFLLPFINVFYRAVCGFDESLIGVICALKPFFAALSGSLVVSAADATQRHFAILLACYVVAYLGRSVMALFAGFGVQLALALVTEAAASLQGSLIDAAVSASATDDGGYGRIRMWASIGWGCAAPVAGYVVGTYGLKAAFLAFTFVVGLTLLPTMLLPMDVLASKAGKAGSSTGGSGGGGGRSSHGSDKCQLSLQDEAPAPPLAVHVSTGFSADGERALPAPTKAAPRPPAAKGWSIGAGAAVGSADPATPAAIHITADCRSSVGQALRLGGPGSASSPLEIASSAASGSSGHRGARKTALVPTAVASGAGGAAAAEMSVWQGLKGLLADVDVAVFLFLAFLMGIGNGSIGFLFLFLDKWGATGTLMGLCLSFNCAAEVPVFGCSGAILERIGVWRALHTAMGAYILRLCCYWALPAFGSPWLVLPVELLQGATFALAWSAGCVLVKRVAPPHLRGTTQSVFAGLYTGIGAGLGGLGGGLLYGRFGSAALFRTAALVLAAGWALAIFVQRTWGGKGKAEAAAAAAAAAAGHVYAAIGPRANSADGEGASLLQSP